MKRLCVLLVMIFGSVSACAETPVILVFGDSISAGYGLPRVELGWVELLKTRLKSEGYGYDVVNASVSGETTAGGLARLPRALQLHRPAIVLLELGGNDGLRALPIEQMRTNFDQMVNLAATAGARVIILGMLIPPNYGPNYTAQFHAAFMNLSRDKRLPLVPFFLDGVALDPKLVQADDIHPNAAGQPRLLENVWPVLKPLLKK